MYTHITYYMYIHILSNSINIKFDVKRLLQFTFIFFVIFEIDSNVSRFL